MVIEGIEYDGTNYRFIVKANGSEKTTALGRELVNAINDYYNKEGDNT